MRLPIFQFAFKLEDNGRIGLVFPSELPYEVQEFGFFLPVPSRERQYSWPYPEIFLDVNEYYFPVEIDGEYKELAASVSIRNPFAVTFDFEMANQDVGFEFGLEPLNPIHNYYRYTGEYRVKDLSQFRFYELKILDVSLLNNLYFERKGIFVGYTREFGDFSPGILG